MEQVNSQLNEYELISLIGKGQMAEVWLARHNSNDSQLALKLLAAPTEKDKAAFIAAFNQEAARLTRLGGPAILPVVDTGSDYDQYYLVMPYLSGGNLADLQKNNPLPRSAAFELFEAILENLDSAHSQGHIHGDLKPANILFDEESQPFLTDFGLATILNGRFQSGLKSLTSLAASPEYKAPEQFNAKAEPRSDLYAAAVLLYWLLTGTVPFTGSSSRQIGIRQAKEAVNLRDAIIPRSMVRFFIRALEKRPENRYPSAADMLAAFHEALENLSPEDLDCSFAGPATQTEESATPAVPQPPVKKKSPVAKAVVTPSETAPAPKKTFTMKPLTPNQAVPVKPATPARPPAAPARTGQPKNITGISKKKAEPELPKLAAPKTVAAPATGEFPVTQKNLPEHKPVARITEKLSKANSEETSPPQTANVSLPPDLFRKIEEMEAEQTDNLGPLDEYLSRPVTTAPLLRSDDITSPPLPPKKLPKVRKSYRLYRNKQMLAEISSLTAAIEEKPDDPDVYIERGMAYKKQGQLSLAMEDFDRAIELDSEYNYAYYVRGNAHFDLKEYKKAISDYDQAIRLDPSDAYTYNHRGLAYHELKQYPAAIKDFDIALELTPEDSAAYYVRGLAYFDYKKYEQAIQDFTRAIELNTYYMTAYSGRGNAYFSLGQYEKAIENYTQALDIDPDSIIDYNNRGNAHRKLKQYTLALLDYDRVIELSPELATAYDQRGNVFAEMKRYHEALENYNQAISLNPNYTSAFNHRGNTHYDMQNYIEAIEDYNRAVQLNPAYSTAYNGRGLAHYQLGHYMEALADYSQALELNPDMAAAYNNRAKIYTMLKKYPEAAGDYTQLIRLEPATLTAFSARAELNRKLERYEEALADYNRTLELTEYKSAPYFNARGEIFLQLKRYQEALADFNKAVGLDPALLAVYHNRGLASMWLNNRHAAQLSYRQAQVLQHYDIEAAWLVEWLGVQYLLDSMELRSRLEKIARLEPNHYLTLVCKGLGLFSSRRRMDALLEFDKAITRDGDRWDAYFWKGLVCYYVEQPQAAEAAIEKALQLGLPPMLLAPLHWLQSDHPEVYRAQVKPLLARFSHSQD
ncbi:MAG TPA: tetratricopeptide repeat protein [Chloroflexia bacterium]|nr:tetratricopeptide repeat protein [Chloroflexia bacterium]